MRRFARLLAGVVAAGSVLAAAGSALAAPGPGPMTNCSGAVCASAIAFTDGGGFAASGQDVSFIANVTFTGGQAAHPTVHTHQDSQLPANAGSVTIGGNAAPSGSVTS